MYTESYFIIFIDKESTISLFAKNWNAFAILVNKLINNII